MAADPTPLAERLKDTAEVLRRLNTFPGRAEDVESAAAIVEAHQRWLNAKVLVSSYPRWLDLSASEKRNYFKARDELKAAEAGLAAAGRPTNDAG